MKKIFSDAFIKIFLTVSLALTSLTSVYLISDKISNERTVQQLQQEYDALVNEKSLLDDRVVKLIGQNTNLNSTFSKVNHALNTLTEFNLNLTNTIKELELENTELVESISSLTEEIETLNNKIKTMSVKPIYGGGGGGGGSYVTPLPPSVSTVPVQDPALLAEIETLKESLSIATSQNTLLQSQLTQLNTLVDSLELSISAKNAEIISLNASITTLNQEKSDLQNNLDALSDDKDLLELLDEKNAEIVILGNLKGQLELDLTSLTITYNNLLDDRNAYKLLSENLSADIVSLNLEIDGYKATIINLNIDIENYKTQVANLNTTITNYASEVSSLQASILAKDSLIASLNETINVKSLEINDLKNENINLLEDIQYYIDLAGPAVDFDDLNRVSQLAVKANVKIEVGSSYGSGVVYKKEVVGNSFEFYILTNYHVIENAVRFGTTINVRNYSNVVRSAELLAYQFHKTETSNNDVDLAVLKVIAGSTNEYYVLNLAPTGSEYNNQTVFSIGTPRGQINTVTVGSIANSTSNVLLSTSVYSSKVFSNVVRHSALIDRGNSGGAVIDINLNIVGINFAGNPQTNTFPFQSVLGYAISIQKIHIFLDENNLK
jgi:S1-C subfamily serine protease